MSIEKPFYIDGLDNKKISYGNFFSDLANIKEFSPLCKQDSIYGYFVNISASLLSGIPITLLDSDLSETEIQNLCGKRDLYAPDLHAVFIGNHGAPQTDRPFIKVAGKACQNIPETLRRHLGVRI